MSTFEQVRFESDRVGHKTRIYVGDVELTDLLPVTGARLSWEVGALNTVKIELAGVPIMAMDAAGSLDLADVMDQLCNVLGVDRVKAALDHATRTP